MKKIIILIVFSLFSFSSFAQQDSQYTQYMYNTITVNPAYAGSREAMSIFGMHRSQWVGLDGAPKTNNFSIHTPIKRSNMGLGLSVVNDKIGPSIENNIAIDFSYTIDASEYYKLSFGLKASANLLDIDFTKLNIYNPNDPIFSQNIDNKFSPNVGAGVYFHSNTTYFGISIPQLLETLHFDRYAQNGASSYVAKEKMNIYFIAGHVFDLSTELKFKPALLAKATQAAPLQVDLSGNFMFNDKFVLGVAYRWSAAASVLAGFQIDNRWYIGYGYDLETNRLANYNSGSHEIFLRYELFNQVDKIMSPRFF